jgi:HEAT repeat protein
MMSGATYYCWSCYSRSDESGGLCRRCGGPIEAPPVADYVDRLVWALDHPLAERRMVAARVLGERREVRATDRLYRLARSRHDPYLAATALRALVSITGRSACADLLADLVQHGPAPVRCTAANLLDRSDGGKEGTGVDG